MPIQATCPNCQRAYDDLPDSVSGKKVKCKCGASFSVQESSPESVSRDSISNQSAERGDSDRLRDLDAVANSDFHGILLAQIFLLIVGLMSIAVASVQAISFFTALNSKTVEFFPPSIWTIVSAIYLSVLGVTSILVAAFLKLGLAIHLNLRKIANRS